ncbi:synaptonemal complex central element protein 3 [Cheilinus undulatus]|uniref:synaptonemal complex central element protein 3 n=1 Tax=Cheilinus undulatus TaxID=241271 RepID=UPI001BD35C29|nr:synaptonemal complex central element protein 3 [Cheilinus undulatus]
MAESSPLRSLLRDDRLELNKNLERLIENVENMSVQLTWMAYDMVTLRTIPELVSSMQQLEEAYNRCRAAVWGDQEPEQDPAQTA